MIETPTFSIVKQDGPIRRSDALPRDGSNVDVQTGLDVATTASPFGTVNSQHWIFDAWQSPEHGPLMLDVSQEPTNHTPAVEEIWGAHALALRQTPNALRSDRRYVGGIVHRRICEYTIEGMVAEAGRQTWSLEICDRDINEIAVEYSTNRVYAPDDRWLRAGHSLTAYEQSETDQRERNNLATKLWISYENESVEDGMTHPAEGIISEVLRSNESNKALSWLKDLCTNESDPVFAASVLRCIGRQIIPGSVNWRVSVIRGGLRADDVEIRDAAVRAAESWKDPQIVEILERHEEPERWLERYISDVVEDLSS